MKKDKEALMHEQRADRQARDKSAPRAPVEIAGIFDQGKQIRSRWDAGQEAEQNSDRNVQQAEDRYRSGGAMLLDVQVWLKTHKEAFKSFGDFLARGCVSAKGEGLAARAAGEMVDIATGKTTLAKSRGISRRWAGVMMSIANNKTTLVKHNALNTMRVKKHRAKVAKAKAIAALEPQQVLFEALVKVLITANKAMKKETWLQVQTFVANKAPSDGTLALPPNAGASPTSDAKYLHGKHAEQQRVAAAQSAAKAKKAEAKKAEAKKTKATPDEAK
jgi:hypothetical protein